eukprot:TRINITY_DN895_c0_g2_i1.p1 TRINITY_DN895_c0_g2~~TRINITY_DN895_c0_g2_i1.p1  ORF type:complete len:360 (-),score=53.02 TRINITY_DN895_c0_g2_i1:27-1106(-)
MDSVSLSSNSKPQMAESGFQREKHIKFLQQCLTLLPAPYRSQEANRMTLVYFALSGLDVLGVLEKSVNEKNRHEWIEWIYSQQIQPDPNHPESATHCGFRGSPAVGSNEYNEYNCSNIAMTYTALLNLRILGDDFSRVNKKAIVNALKYLQQKDGSFLPIIGGAESDVRFIYTACAISFMLNDWSGIDQDKAVQYIIASQGYDGGIAQGPFQETHGGSSYCGIASLYLMGKLDLLPKKELLKKWLIDKQVSGFQGRANKDPDACYSFWIGGAIHILGIHSLLDYPSLMGFSYSCQFKIGGFGKAPDSWPDVLHTYFGLCGLSLCGESGLSKIDPALGLTQRAAGDWYREIKQVEVSTLV